MENIALLGVRMMKLLGCRIAVKGCRNGAGHTKADDLLETEDAL